MNNRSPDVGPGLKGIGRKEEAVDTTRHDGVAASNIRISQSALRLLERSVAHLTAWWQANRLVLFQVGAVFLSLRILLTLLAVLSSGMLPPQSELHSTYHRSDNLLLDVWARWDSEYYLDIASQGYLARPELPVFFPFYPMLLAATAKVVGHDYVLSGILVSSLACFIALFYMFKLAELELGEESARRALLYLAAYPMALFMMAVYTESLFLAVILAAFYYARRRRWLAAGIATLLAGITRPTGLVLVFPLAYEAWSQAGGTIDWATWRRLINWRVLLAVAGAPLSWLLYAIYLGGITGDRFAILHSRSQPPFLRQTSLPWDTVGLAISNLSHPSLSVLSRTVNTADLVATIFLIEATIVAWWALPRLYAVYCAASLFLLLSLTIPEWPLQSMPRYTLTVFPIFFLLAKLGANRYWHQAILMAGLLLLGIYTALFANWYWVF
ncbi:MAG: hypothetical protein M3014_10655 [Chloroflexota bacterium]|nr:hypothetical protein [Chloroflexota bacterium]